MSVYKICGVALAAGALPLVRAAVVAGKGFDVHQTVTCYTYPVSASGYFASNVDYTLNQDYTFHITDAPLNFQTTFTGSHCQTNVVATTMYAPHPNTDTKAFVIVADASRVATPSPAPATRRPPSTAPGRSRPKA